jgi:hypothetical protein
MHKMAVSSTELNTTYTTSVRKRENVPPLAQIETFQSLSGELPMFLNEFLFLLKTFLVQTPMA